MKKIVSVLVLIISWMGVQMFDNPTGSLPINSSIDSSNEVGSFVYEGIHQEIIVEDNQPNFISKELSLSEGIW